jgi:aminoglycoside 6'-N-acetyltransferase I
LIHELTRISTKVELVQIRVNSWIAFFGGLMLIRHATLEDQAEWLRMRAALWPHCPLADHHTEMRAQLADAARYAVFVVERDSGKLGGFLEASLRQYADGCRTSPVGYIEGWYVDADLRQQGWGGALVTAAEHWAGAQGCAEMASDCELDNDVSFYAHLALGYEEVDRAIQFRKLLIGK